jgi:hypothetical protein
MSAGRIYFKREEASDAARLYAYINATPVFWGRHPAQRIGYTLHLRPCGDERELVVLTMPPPERRKGQAWTAAVLAQFRMLMDLEAEARAKGRFAEAFELAAYAEHLVRRSGLLRPVFEAARNRVLAERERAAKIARDMAEHND